MITAEAKDIKSITLLLKEKDFLTVKAILKFLKDKYQNFTIMKFKTGKIGENILLSFKVHNEFYPTVLEKFAYNEIPLIMQDKNVIEFIDQKKEQKRRKLRTQGWSEISKTKRQISLKDLHKFSEEGKIKEVAKEAKGGLGSSLNIVKKARELLNPTIENAINNLLVCSEEKIGKKQEVIDQLILIASDKELKLFHKYDEMLRAGMLAIELSIQYKNYYHNLIKIANNSKLNNINNVKAIIKFAEVYNSCSDKEKEKLPNIVKLLNTRWLRIAFETIQQKLSSDEIEIFNSFIEFVEEQRKIV